MKKLINLILVFSLSFLMLGCSPSDNNYYISDSIVVTSLDSATYSSVQNLKFDGAIVVCKMSVGTYQYWNEDAGDFYIEDIGYNVDYLVDESYIDINSNSVLSIMLNRIDKAYQIGCDKVLLDNVDTYEYNTGFYINYSDEYDYLSYLISEIHYYGMESGTYEIDVYNSFEMTNLFDFILD